MWQISHTVITNSKLILIAPVFLHLGSGLSFSDEILQDSMLVHHIPTPISLIISNC